MTQTDISGGETPLDELQPVPQRAMCTGDESCEADCDEHFGDCPVERELRDAFGF